MNILHYGLGVLVFNSKISFKDMNVVIIGSVIQKNTNCLDYKLNYLIKNFINIKLFN